MDNILFDYFSIGAIIPFYFLFFTSVFFLTIKNRTSAAFHLGICLFMMALFNLAYTWSGSIDHPSAARHRWMTVLTVFPAAIHLAQFFMHFPENNRPRLARGLLAASYLVSLSATVWFIIKTSSAQTVFKSTGHYWDFIADSESRIIGLLIFLSAVFIILAGVYKAVINRGMRKILIALTLAAVFGTIVPSILNVLSRDGAIERGTFQLWWDMLNILAFFSISILFINTTRDKTTFMAKLVSITLATFLLVLQATNYIALQSLDSAYDDLKKREFELAAYTGRHKSALRYLVTYTGKEQLEYRFKEEDTGIAPLVLKVDLQNLMALHKGLDGPSDSAAEKKQSSGKWHPQFAGYAAVISALKQLNLSPAELDDRYEGFQRSLDYARNRFKKIKEGPEYRQKAFEFIKKQSGDSLSGAFFTALAEKEEGFKDEKLRQNLLLHMRPLPHNSGRQYRITQPGSVNHRYITYQFYLPEQGRAYEAGFDYRDYRRYVHDPSSRVMVTILVIVIIVLVLFRLFFWGSLVYPLNLLLEGVRKVNDGDFSVQVPIKVEDEIGFLSRSFNGMVGSINNARQKLQDYADNLEEKVKERTSELKKSLDEIHTLKSQQDADYFLTSLLIKPLGSNRASTDSTVSVEFLSRQKKQFSFRKWDSEIGGDLNKAHHINLRGRPCTVFLNADAMGKSMQGAGGALVLGAVFESIIERTKARETSTTNYPERWLKNSFVELHKVFESFDGSMLISLVMGIIDDQSGMMYFMNAEHPQSVLYRDGVASFLEQGFMFRKLGTPITGGQIVIQTMQLEAGDVIILGSDGRDDVLLGVDEKGNRVINEDETVFLKCVEHGKGELENIFQEVIRLGELTDDISMIRLQFMGRDLEDRTAERQPEINALINRARQAYSTGRLSEALAALEEAHHIDPADDRVVRRLVKYHLESGSHDQAASMAHNYTNLNPDDIEMLYVASACFRKTGQLQAAADMGERIRLRHPGMVKNNLSLARIYQRLNNPGRARIMLQDVLDIDTENKQARAMLDELS